jgi:hypothetical protein
MSKSLRTISLIAFVLMILPLAASAVVEPKTKTEYPDTATIEVGGAKHELAVTGVGLREKTLLKVDVYTIVSYVAAGTTLADDQGVSLLTVDAPKQLRMDLRRGFSREKLIKSFQEVIEKNYDDTSAFDAEMETFFGYFVNDAQENDVLIFTYAPGQGLTTNLNGEEKGVIANFSFTQALWTVWFGEKPANGGLKKALLSEL